jgi:hypothetical protein
MLKLTFITKEQDNLRHEYTKDEINELFLCANGISSIIGAMSWYSYDSQAPTGPYGPVFDVLGKLMEPITDFLGEECPMKEEPLEVKAGTLSIAPVKKADFKTFLEAAETFIRNTGIELVLPDIFKQMADIKGVTA